MAHQLRRVIPAALLALLGCSVPGRHVTPQDLGADGGTDRPVVPTPLERFPDAGLGVPSGAGAPPAPVVLDPADSAQAQRERAAFDDRARELARRREDYDRGVVAYNDRLAAAQLEHRDALTAEALERQRLDRHLRFAEQDLTHFLESVRRRRQREAELSLRKAEDEAERQREEVEQLERLYGDEDLGDATAEIVLARARRALAIAEAEVELERLRAADVERVELPRRREELEAAIADRQAEIELLTREHERAAVIRNAELRGLEHERFGLERQLEDLERDLERYAAEVDDWQRALVERAGSGP